MFSRKKNPLIGPPSAQSQPLVLKAPRRRTMGSVIGHTGFNVARYHTTHVFGALFPLLAGALLFGYRAMATVLVVVGSTLLGGLIWRRIGVHGHTIRPVQLLWLGLLLALMMPANLLRTSSHPATWPLLPAAGLMVVILCWAQGNVGAWRFHPVIIVYLLLALMYGFSSETVLQRNRLMLGDVLAAPAQQETRSTQASWRKRPLLPAQDAIHALPVSHWLADFTHPRTSTMDSNVASDGLSPETLVRDRLPALEDIVLGAVPGGIGVTSAVAVIVGGLFLLYRGLIDFRIPLMITFAAWAALLIFPVPIQSHWRWLPGHVPGVGWAMAVTLANYQVLASPLLFTAFFLAGSPLVRPLSKRGRSAYSITIGILAAVLQLYVSVSLGSYLAVMVVGLLTPLMDRFLNAKPLV